MRKIFSAALALVCIWFATPVHAALPSGYTELQYIESTGTQYIDTGVGLNAANKITGKISFVTLNNLAYIAGGRLSGGVAVGYALYGASHSGFTIYNTSWPEQGVDVSANQILEYETVMKSGQQSFIVNGNTIVTGDRTISLDSNNIYLFGLKTEYMAAAKVYSLKIYDNNTLVRDFVPAKNSSGVVGMYDTVGNRFYTNAGTGEFVAGDPVVENNTCTKNGFGFANESIIYNVGANFLDNYSAESGRSLTYSDETAVCAVTGSGSASNGFIGSQTVVFTSGHKYATIAYLNATGRFNIGLARVSPSDSVTGGTSSSMQEATNGWTWSALPLNAVVDGTAVINARISTGVLQVKEMYLIDLTALFGAGNEPTTKSEIIAALTTNPCPSSIKIATTKYNETAFSPLNTALQNAISVVDSVVSNTITQAGRIATLQAQKQTRPNDIADDNEKCPAGIKCLLVEDANGTLHWYAIQESYLPLGYTPLQYINKPSGAYTDSGIKFTSENVTIEITGSISSMVDGMFGAQDGSNNHSALLIYANHLYAGENGFVNPTIFDSDLHKIIIEANNKNITLTNYAGEVVNLSYTQSIQSRNGWYIGGMRSNDRVLTNSIGKVGIIKIWDNGNLVFHGIPAKYGEEIGFYDIVQNRFLTSMSEQKFTAGPVAE